MNTGTQDAWSAVNEWFSPSGSDEPVGDEEQSAAAVVGARIQDLRARAGMRAVELAERVGITKDKLSKVESGARRVSAREAPLFAEALGVPLGYLVRGDIPSPALAMRLTDSATTENVSTARSRASEVLEIADRLQRKHYLASPRETSELAAARSVAAQFPPMENRESAQRQGRQFAEAVRSALGVGVEPLNDLPTLIEKRFTADVVLGSFGAGVAGLCAHGNGQALLLANSDMTLGAVRFTLAHELGHHLLGDPREVIEEDDTTMYASTFVERRVNSFAGHLLLPAGGVTSVLTFLGVGKQDFVLGAPAARIAVGSLMAFYRVSLECALHQLLDLRWASWETISKLKGRWSAHDLLREVAPSLGDQLNIAEPDRRTHVPLRLLLATTAAARSGDVGTSTVARLLQRPDDEALLEEFVGYREDDLGTGE